MFFSVTSLSLSVKGADIFAWREMVAQILVNEVVIGVYFESV